MRRGNKLRTRLLMILALLSLTISAGCIATIQSHKMPPKPVKPTIEVQKGPEKGICLDGKNTEKLMNYILLLEEGYGE